MNATNALNAERYVALPLLFLTVALLGGWRLRGVDKAFVFVAPPLVTLVLALLLLSLLVRGQLFEVRRWFSGDVPLLTNLSHGVLLVTLFFASAQAFNAVLPESGLFSWLFSFFFLWTLWQQQFAPFAARRLLRSLAALFGTAYILKYWILASLTATGDGWTQKLLGLALEGLSLNGPAFAPASAYIAFFALVLYVLGLFLVLVLAPAHTTLPDKTAQLIEAYHELTPAQQNVVRVQLDATARPALPEISDSE